MDLAAYLDFGEVLLPESASLLLLLLSSSRQRAGLSYACLASSPLACLHRSPLNSHNNALGCDNLPTPRPCYNSPGQVSHLKASVVSHVPPESAPLRATFLPCNNLLLLLLLAGEKQRANPGQSFQPLHSQSPTTPRKRPEHYDRALSEHYDRPLSGCDRDQK